MALPGGVVVIKMKESFTAFRRMTYWEDDPGDGSLSGDADLLGMDAFVER
jgi:hypothetical protein